MPESRQFQQKKPIVGEEIAISALAFLAADEERIDRFLALSGLDPGRLREAAAEPGFLAGVLRHIMEDDRLASAFAAEHGLSAEALNRAAAQLGAHWERDTP